LSDKLSMKATSIKYRFFSIRILHAPSLQVRREIKKVPEVSIT
jgi:hypothetical protein